MRVRLLLVIIAALSAAAGLGAQNTGFSVTVDIDWKGARVGLFVSRNLDPSIPSLQKAEDDAETAIDAGFTGLLVESLSSLAVDSSRTVGSLAAADSGFYSWLQSLARTAHKDTLVLSPDFKKATAGYGLSLFTDTGIASPLYPAQDQPISRRLGFVPTPALFPRIFDEEMNVVLDKSMCRPAALKKWGMVGYADSVDESAILLRCGTQPLTVVARAVFGANRTDLVISSRAAQQILALPRNIELLKEGKILIVYPALK
jgi:hypothetical protein